MTPVRNVSDRHDQQYPKAVSQEKQKRFAADIQEQINKNYINNPIESRFDFIHYNSPFYKAAARGLMPPRAIPVYLSFMF